MELAIHGKQMDVGDALRTHVATKLEEINAKYFNRAIDITVTFAPEGHGFVKTHISLRVGKDIMVISDATETDPYVAFDQAANFRTPFRSQIADGKVESFGFGVRARGLSLANHKVLKSANVETKWLRPPLPGNLAGGREDRMEKGVVQAK